MDFLSRLCGFVSSAIVDHDLHVSDVKQDGRSLTSLTKVKVTVAARCPQCPRPPMHHSLPQPQAQRTETRSPLGVSAYRHWRATPLSECWVVTGAYK